MTNKNYRKAYLVEEDGVPRSEQRLVQPWPASLPPCTLFVQVGKISQNDRCTWANPKKMCVRLSR